MEDNHPTGITIRSSILFAHTTRLLHFFVRDRRKLGYDVLSPIFQKALNTTLIIRLLVLPSSSQSRVDDERSGQRVPMFLAIMDHYDCFTNLENLVTATLAFACASTCVAAFGQPRVQQIHVLTYRASRRPKF